MAQKLEQVEENAPEAEDLRDVMSVEDAATEAYAAVIDPSTQLLRIKPGKTMTTPPATPEELRLRHRRLGLAWEMARSKHSTRSWLPERAVDAFRQLLCWGPRWLACVHRMAAHQAGARFYSMKQKCASTPTAMYAMVMLRIWPQLWGKRANRLTSLPHTSLCPSPSVRLRLQPSRLFRSRSGRAKERARTMTRMTASVCPSSRNT